MYLLSQVNASLLKKFLTPNFWMICMY